MNLNVFIWNFKSKNDFNDEIHVYVENHFNFTEFTVEKFKKYFCFKICLRLICINRKKTILNFQTEWKINKEFCIGETRDKRFRYKLTFNGIIFLSMIFWPMQMVRCKYRQKCSVRHFSNLVGTNDVKNAVYLYFIAENSKCSLKTVETMPNEGKKTQLINA